MSKQVINPSFKPIFDRIDCGTGLIFCDTPEETRAIREVATHYKSKNHKIYFWSMGQGMHFIDKTKIDVERFFPHKFKATECRRGKGNDLRTESDVIATFALIEEDCRAKVVDSNEDESRNIYFLRDIHVFFNNPVILRRLRDLIYLASTSSSTIITTGFGITVPNDIEKDTFYYKLPFPRKDEVTKILENTKLYVKSENEKRKDDKTYTKKDVDFNMEDVTRACIGLTEDQIINVLMYSLEVLDKVDIHALIEEKRSIINKSDILEFWPCNENLDSVGGFNEFKKWANVQKTVLDNVENARKFNTEPPKAILLVGVSGSGKTLIAKALANTLNTSLLKFDIGKVFGSLMGESEKRARQALRLADEVGGVMVIDELEKGLSGAGSSDKTDGGTTNRVIGTFLTWLNEEHPNLLLVATANNIQTLLKNHPELFRSGRFDKIWFSDTPNEREREEIFAIHLKKKGRDPKKFDLKKLAKFEHEDKTTTYTYTGAEIEISIRDALRNKFSENEGKAIEIGSKNDINEDDIIKTLKLIKPITKIGKDAITVTRNWAQDNAINVSSELVKTKKTTSKSFNIRNDDVQL